MAGILERMNMIAKSNINDLLNKFEDPAKVVDQAIVDAKEELGRVKRDSLPVFANEKSAKSRLDVLKAEEEKWHNIAISALKAGNEDDARNASAILNEKRAAIATQETTVNAAVAASEKLRGKIQEMEEEIREMQNKAAEIKAVAATAKATKAANSVTVKGIDHSAKDAFDRMQDKAERELAEAEAMESLSVNTVEKANADLEKKYKAGGEASVDATLDELRKELGL